MLENFKGSVYPFLAFPSKQSIFSKHSWKMLELLRLQRCYQSVHGFGNSNLLSQDELEHHRDDDDDDDDDDGDDSGC